LTRAPRPSSAGLSRPLALLLAALVFTAGCTGFKKVNLYSVPEELAVGEVFSSQVEAYYPVLHDPHLSWYLNHRGRMLVDLSDRRDIPYEFNIVDNPELNAFALPGGHVYIHLGMFEATESEAELLGVVAHEIGHVIAQHSMKQMSQQNIIAIIGTVALNQYPNQWAALAANLFATGGILKMSRDAEREADAIGFELMVRAGYDPHGMEKIFDDLRRKYSEEPGMLDKLFATHPPTLERIQNIRAMIDARPLPANLMLSSPEYQQSYDYMVRKYYSEPGRRRWKAIIAEKENKEKKAEDRLPWDRKNDREREREKEKERAEREKKRGHEEGALPSPTPAPSPAAEPRPESTPPGESTPPAGGPR
jgi:predicted Zn-dependent protease